MRSGRSDRNKNTSKFISLDPELAYIQITITGADDGKAPDYENANGAQLWTCKNTMENTYV